MLDLFTKITDLEKLPEDSHKGIIKPFHKEGSMYDLDNYRGITLTSNVCKVYAKIIEQFAMSYMEAMLFYVRLRGLSVGRVDGGQHFYSTRDMCTSKIKKG